MDLQLYLKLYLIEPLEKHWILNYNKYFFFVSIFLLFLQDFWYVNWYVCPSLIQVHFDYLRLVTLVHTQYSHSEFWGCLYSGFLAFLFTFDMILCLVWRTYLVSVVELFIIYFSEDGWRWRQCRWFSFHLPCAQLSHGSDPWPPDPRRLTDLWSNCRPFVEPDDVGAGLDNRVLY